MDNESRYRRTVCAINGAPNSKSLKGAEYFIDKINNDKHLILDDLQNYINAVYIRNHPLEEKFGVDFLNSLEGRLEDKEKAKQMLKDFKERFIKNGTPIIIEKDEEGPESKFRFG